jgi:NADP-dependent 3-hydroxy acid dehydrogenase YdfG
MKSKGMNNLPLAIVTGGSSGIGLAITGRLISESYTVINADIQPPSGDEFEYFLYQECDVTNKDHVERLSRLVQEMGVPEVLVLNAGRGIHERLREGDPEKWFEIINLNICGALRVLRAVLPFMKKGHVFFISSVSSTNPYPYGGVYAATKSALDTIAETLRQEELPDIKVTVISPGVVDTSFFRKMISGSQAIESIGWGSLDPEEVAGAVAYVLQQRGGTAIHQITIRPAGQIL